MSKGIIFEDVDTNRFLDSAEFFTDVETGVMYIGISSGSRYGITPRLDKDGKPMINPDYDKK